MKKRAGWIMGGGGGDHIHICIYIYCRMFIATGWFLLSGDGIMIHDMEVQPKLWGSP